MSLPLCARTLCRGDSEEPDHHPNYSWWKIGSKNTVWARRAARHRLEGTGIVPTHTVNDFEELRRILAREYGVPMA